MPQSTTRHGTAGAYRKGCRCEECRAHKRDSRIPRLIRVPCAYCGDLCTKAPEQVKRARDVFCSYDCRDTYRHGQDRRPSSARRRDAIKRQARAAAGSTGATAWVAGPCAGCGTAFVFNQPAARTCSKRCAKRVTRRQYGRTHGWSNKNHRKRARELGVAYEPISPRYIFERDGWRCGICHNLTLKSKKVPHPQAPTLDHIIPMSVGGPHLKSNVQCACFECNWRKGVGGTDQLRLVG